MTIENCNLIIYRKNNNSNEVIEVSVSDLENDLGKEATEAILLGGIISGTEYSYSMNKDEIAKGLEVLSVDHDIMTEDEFTRFKSLEQVISSGVNSILSVAKQIGDALSEIRDKKYYSMRSEGGSFSPYSSFESYIKDRFGKGKTMGYNYISVSNVLGILSNVGVSETDIKTIGNAVTMSDKVKRLVRGTVDDDQEQMVTRKVMETYWNVIKDTAPVDSDGKIIITNQHIEAVGSVLTDVVKSETVEIEGNQVPISLAKLAVDDTVAQTIYEQTMRQKQAIIESTKKRKKSLIKKIESPLIQSTVNDKFFSITCPVHGQTEPSSLVKAGFVCLCGCFAVISMIDNNSSKFTWKGSDDENR